MILAVGFYNWACDEADRKTPFWIYRREREPFGFVGLWERWTSHNLDEHVTTTIITAPASDGLKPGTFVKVVYDEHALGARHAEKIIVPS